MVDDLARAANQRHHRKIYRRKSSSILVHLSKSMIGKRIMAPPSLCATILLAVNFPVINYEYAILT
jgi:hypothetical protein